MQVFANGKRRFHSFIKFYPIHLQNQEVKFDHSSTLILQPNPKDGTVPKVCQITKTEVCQKNLNQIHMNRETHFHLKNLCMAALSKFSARKVSLL